jgi:hypothetical protein
MYGAIETEVKNTLSSFKQPAINYAGFLPIRVHGILTE